MSKQRFNFQRQFPQHWATSKQLCEYGHLYKIKKQTSSQEHNIFKFQIKIIQTEYSELKIFFTLFPILRDISGGTFVNL